MQNCERHRNTSEYKGIMRFLIAFILLLCVSTSVFAKTSDTTIKETKPKEPSVGLLNRVIDGDTFLSINQKIRLDVTAELVSTISTTSKSFTLHSSLSQPNPYGFSGISGGPVYCINSTGEISPAGLVFEGHPSGEEEGCITNGFYQKNDISIRALALNRETFEGWLVNSENNRL